MSSPPIIPFDEIQADLKAQELGVTKITQIIKTDKTTETPTAK
jgi:hypothetical protein